MKAFYVAFLKMKHLVYKFSKMCKFAPKNRFDRLSAFFSHFSSESVTKYPQ